MKGHKTIVKKQYVLLLLFIAVLCISACSAPASEPSSSNNVSEVSTLNPVSYTHLDVYKRQALPLTGRLNPKSLRFCAACKAAYSCLLYTSRCV